MFFHHQNGDKKMKRRMRWLLDYLVILSLNYFTLHVEELSVYFNFFLVFEISIFFNQWCEIIKQNTVLFMKRMINYEWSNIRAQSKVDWAMHSAAFTATWIQFPKLSQFLLKHINTILLRKAYNAFKASPSLFHHQICNRFIYVFITWPLHSYTILFFLFPYAWNIILFQSFIIGKGCLTLMETALYYVPLPFFSNFVQHFPTLLFLLPCFFGWMCHHATSNVSLYLMTILI